MIGAGGKPETGNLKLEIGFVPLNIPERFKRKTVTSLVEKSLSLITHRLSRINPAVYGSLGHAVLEELAKNRWVGDVPALVELFGDEFGKLETESLIKQLEAAREALRKETAEAETLWAEHPFVLKRGDVILDGTIDLLAQMSSNVWKILDYKFTNESPETALGTYAPQLEAYCEAVRKLYPDAEVSAALVLIGASVQTVRLRG